MGLDIFVGYSSDWSEYDRLMREFIGKKYGKEKDEEEAKRLHDAVWKFEREKVTSDMPDEWREKLGISKDEPAWYIGYIARSSAVYAFDYISLDVEGEEAFPSLCEMISCGYNDYVRNDWEYSLSLAKRCLAATRAFIEKGEDNMEVFSAHHVLEHLVPLAELIIASGEPQNYRIRYDR